MEKKYLSIIGLARTEQSFQRIVARNQETSEVDEKLAGNIEEYQEEVNPGKAEESIDFWDGGLLLEIVEHWVLG